MGKNEFVDASLVKIRDKLSSAARNGEGRGDSDLNGRPGHAFRGNKAETIPGTASSSTYLVSDKEWKKALFARWDEYKSDRRDVMARVKSRLARVPLEMERHQKSLDALRVAEGKLRQLIEELDELDDSAWSRSNFASELAAAVKKVENARIECVVLENSISANSPKAVTDPTAANLKGDGGFIHELLSVSFTQAFKLGTAFFLPLAIAILAAALLLALLNYLAVT